MSDDKPSRPTVKGSKPPPSTVECAKLPGPTAKRIAQARHTLRGVGLGDDEQAALLAQLRRNLARHIAAAGIATDYPGPVPNVDPIPDDRLRVVANLDEALREAEHHDNGGARDFVSEAVAAVVVSDRQRAAASSDRPSRQKKPPKKVSRKARTEAGYLVLRTACEAEAQRLGYPGLESAPRGAKKVICGNVAVKRTADGSPVTVRTIETALKRTTAAGS